MHSAFQVENWLRLDENKWYVIGRALNDIQLGDTLISETEFAESRNSNQLKSTKFLVISITIYRKSVEFVSKGYTAGITLQCESNSNIIKARNLILIEPH